MAIIQDEAPRTILGVKGRAHNVVTWHGNGNSKAPNEIANQTWKSEARPVDPEYWGKGAQMRVELRFDDNCKNGKMSFALTGEIFRPNRRDVEACGCLHDEAAQYFPELAPLIKWHLTDTGGPMHYIANTCYHASNRDHRGLLKGEEKQLVNGRTKQPVWELVAVGPDGVSIPRHELPSMTDSAECPTSEYSLVWAPTMIVGEGKERNLEAARSAAVWPNAPESILTGPREELEAALIERASGIRTAFQNTMINDCGFLFSGEPADA